ncbi:hypothetical protein BKA60DRAFT_545629 [Fusarium oxysporum]|nr:hypothetical protein BKA60DRAFT_545629 [Fusarium oxysporum]
MTTVAAMASSTVAVDCAGTQCNYPYVCVKRGGSGQYKYECCLEMLPERLIASALARWKQAFLAWMKVQQCLNSRGNRTLKHVPVFGSITSGRTKTSGKEFN